TTAIPSSTRTPERPRTVALILASGPVADSTRSSTCSTHSSVPILVVPMTSSDLLEAHPSKETRWAEEDHCDEDQEDEQVLERGRHVTDHHRFDHADQYPTDDRPRQASKAPDDGCAEALERRRKSHEVVDASKRKAGDGP